MTARDWCVCVWGGPLENFQDPVIPVLAARGRSRGRGKGPGRGRGRDKGRGWGRSRGQGRDRGKSRGRGRGRGKLGSPTSFRFGECLKKQDRM